jgi:hypothetical protein
LAEALVITTPGAAGAISSTMSSDPSNINRNWISVAPVTFSTPTAKVPGCPEASVPAGAQIVEGFRTAIEPSS